jgi:adenosylmethionine-8-amino-7-oxononanoate aminotransferase
MNARKQSLHEGEIRRSADRYQTPLRADREEPPIAEQEGASRCADQLLDLDRKLVWHHLSAHRADPLIVREAAGCWITDIHGNRYFDGMSGLWCVNVGYGREELASAAAEQIRKMSYYPLTQGHVPAVRLAAKLNEWLGGGYRFFFSNSGSDANEVAFKIARQYHAQNGRPHRHKIISRYRAYHGYSMGALAATGQAQRKVKFEPLSPGFVHVPPPYSYRCACGRDAETCQLQCAARALEETIVWEGPDSVAAVIMEPAISGGGVIVPTRAYMRAVRDICDRYGVLLIIDEVICGFGRSGEKFGHLNYGIKPDMVTMAKGITSGYAPLSATAVREELFAAFTGGDPDGYFRHLNTFGGHPVSCAVALRNLQLMEEERLVERARVLGEQLGEQTAGLLDHPRVGDVRRFGLMLGIELVADKETKAPLSDARVQAVIAACKRKGLIIGRNGDTVPGQGNVLTLCPPLVTTDEELAFVTATLADALAELE